MTIRPQVVGAMTPFPHSVDCDAPLIQARRFMREHKVHHLPVTRNAKLVGVLADRDVKLMLGPDFDYPDEKEMTVADVYVDDAYIVDASTPLDLVIQTMAERRIGSALVTRKDKLVGIYTTTDVCRDFARDLRHRYAVPPGDSVA